MIIVLVVIAVLAIVAVPNFMESAPLHGPISDRQNELHAIARAIEQYQLEQKRLPPVTALGEMDQRLLTTPIAYLQKMPVDLFRKKAGQNDPHYRICVSTEETTSVSGTPVVTTRWMTWSIGRDLLTNTAGYRSFHDVETNEASPQPAIGIDRTGRSLGAPGYGGMRYDPTNGATSYGDIYRFDNGLN
ncbi:type II secretion system GspH family protein [bacterium]|nr:type II secretion system GspH family protein [bacterium]